MKNLALFVHGLGGAAASTWKKFPDLVRSDPELAARYDAELFEYSTRVVGRAPSLAECATLLKTEIDHRYPSYAAIAIIAHSQGGLISRQYIAERINSAQPLRVDRLLTFATPHQGSGWATLVSRVPFASRQAEDLDPNSQFLQALAVAWGQAKADRRVLTKHVGAVGDAIVGPVSAMGAWNPNYDVVDRAGHVSVVKPEDADAISFLVAKNFLLQEPMLPGGVEADYRPPLLRLFLVNADEATRFLYSARVLPLIGRDAELGILADFLDHGDVPFRWMVMHGSAGTGKSRLALEACLAVRGEWHAGFLPQGGQEPDWGRWQPLVPTLIVIDSAARDAERNGSLLQALAGRGTADGTLALEAPVRVVLLERAVEGGWLDTVVGDEVTKALVDNARAPDLRLAAISDAWPIFEFVLAKKNAALPDKAETLAAFAEIDPERRPLFAYFMADAMSRGDDVRHFDAKRLLDQVIDHSRKAYWVPAGATGSDERLMALATMTGGLPVNALDDVRDRLLARWDVDRHPAVFLAMTGEESSERIAPLQPDIVGEHFALACLAQGNLSNDDRARMCALAWQLDPRNMGAFARRSHHDLPGHPILRWIRKPPPTEGAPQQFWAMAAADMMVDLRSRDLGEARALLDEIRRVATEHNDPVVWEGWTLAASTSIGGDLTSLLRRSVLGDRLGPPTPDTPRADGSTGFFAPNPLVARDLAAAGALLDDIRRVASDRNETSLWGDWTYAALAVLDALFTSDPAQAVALLNEVSQAIARGRAEDPLNLWCAMALNIVNASALPWLGKIRAVASARNDQSLWELWADFAVEFMDRLISLDPGQARALLGQMHEAAAQGGNSALWTCWATAAATVATGLKANDVASASALLEQMHDAAAEHNEDALWGIWAMVASNLAGDIAARDVVAARALLDELRRVVPAFDTDLAWQLWAKAARDVLQAIGPQDLDAARTLLDALRDVAETRAQGEVLELWAKATGRLMIDLRSGDPQGARALLDTLHDAAARHDGLLPIWAKAAVILIDELRRQDGDAAKALAAQVRSLAPDILKMAGISPSEIED